MKLRYIAYLCLLSILNFAGNFAMEEREDGSRIPEYVRKNNNEVAHPAENANRSIQSESSEEENEENVDIMELINDFLSNDQIEELLAVGILWQMGEIQFNEIDNYININDLASQFTDERLMKEFNKIFKEEAFNNFIKVFKGEKNFGAAFLQSLKLDGLKNIKLKSLLRTLQIKSKMAENSSRRTQKPQVQEMSSSLESKIKYAFFALLGLYFIQKIILDICPTYDDCIENMSNMRLSLGHVLFFGLIYLLVNQRYVIADKLSKTKLGANLAYLGAKGYTRTSKMVGGNIVSGGRNSSSREVGTRFAGRSDASNIRSGNITLDTFLRNLNERQRNLIFNQLGRRDIDLYDNSQREAFAKAISDHYDELNLSEEQIDLLDLLLQNMKHT